MRGIELVMMKCRTTFMKLDVRGIGSEAKKTVSEAVRHHKFTRRKSVFMKLAMLYIDFGPSRQAFYDPKW
jgi:hypothetical protein